MEGIWFDKNEIEKVLKADSRNFKKIDVDREELDGQEAVKMHKDFNKKSALAQNAVKKQNLITAIILRE